MPLIAALTSTWSKADLLAGFERVGVPAGPINSLDEVFADPQVLDRRMVSHLPEPKAAGGSVPSLRGPIVIDGATMAATSAAPRLDQHGAAVLSDPAWGGSAAA